MVSPLEQDSITDEQRKLLGDARAAAQEIKDTKYGHLAPTLTSLVSEIERLLDVNQPATVELPPIARKSARTDIPDVIAEPLIASRGTYIDDVADKPKEAPRPKAAYAVKQFVTVNYGNAEEPYLETVEVLAVKWDDKKQTYRYTLSSTEEGADPFTLKENNIHGKYDPRNS